MAAPNRASILTKAHKVLKEHYTPVLPPKDISVLDALLYSCCLENAPFQNADDAFAKLQESYFGWNEVRVATATELAEMMSDLPAPRAAAGSLKRCLQNVFETEYAFDLEGLRKENLGKAVKKLEKYGAPPFAIAYVTQATLGGHAIPIDKGALDTLYVLGAITEQEAAKGQTPGLERAIPKSKGVEFGSLLHQLAVEFHASPHGTNPRKIMLEIEPQAKERFPKRTVKKKKAAAKTKKKTAAAGKAKTTAKKKSAKTSQTATTKKKTAKVARKKSATKRLTKKKPR